MKIEKVPVNKIIEFRRLSEKRQRTFINNLKVSKEAKKDDNGSGGDYWVRSISSISSAFRQNDTMPIRQKIDDILADYNDTERRQTKIMYERNLNILHNYEDFDFSIWRPIPEPNFLRKRPKSILPIKGLPVQIRPNHIFSFKEAEKQKIGAIWFVTKLEGYKAEELGMFSESIYRYLLANYSSKYEIDPAYCLTVDTPNMQMVSYHQVLNDGISSLIDSTIDKMNKYL